MTPLRRRVRNPQKQTFRPGATACQQGDRHRPAKARVAVGRTLVTVFFCHFRLNGICQPRRSTWAVGSRSRLPCFQGSRAPRRAAQQAPMLGFLPNALCTSLLCLLPQAQENQRVCSDLDAPASLNRSIYLTV